MRKDCNWFADRAKTIWKASPGKSFLILSPHGIPELRLASLLKESIEKAFIMPDRHSNARPVVVSLSPDTTRSSSHFVRRIGKQLAKASAVQFDYPDLNDPSDLLLEIVESALDEGIHPILIIERFHAFVDIVDDALLSTLSTLRTLEHNSQITTIAISPISYTQMRRQMPATSAFVNSSYGDNHDWAIPTPLTKSDYLPVAIARGLTAAEAQKLFTLVGGPDLFYEKLIEAQLEGSVDVVGVALSRLGDHVHTFLSTSFPELMGDDGKILSRLGLGALTPLDLELIQSNPLKDFVIKRDAKRGATIATTPVLSRWALLNGDHNWSAYERARTAVQAGDAAAAAAYLADKRQAHPRLQCFCDTIHLIASVDGGIDAGMLAVDWNRALKFATLVVENAETPAAIEFWARQVMSYAKMVTSAFGKGEMLRLDKLTVQASNPAVEILLLHAITAFVKKVKRHQNPAVVVKALATIPESILQAVAAARLSLNYASSPALDSKYAYNDFFVGPGVFVVPEPGRKLDMTPLLVVLAAMLSGSKPETVLSDRQFVLTLQSRLVGQLRNVVAHTAANFDKKDGDYLIQVSEQLLEAWRAGAGIADAQNPLIDFKPDSAALASLLYGDFDIDPMPPAAEVLQIPETSSPEM